MALTKTKQKNRQKKPPRNASRFRYAQTRDYWFCVCNAI